MNARILCLLGLIVALSGCTHIQKITADEKDFELTTRPAPKNCLHIAHIYAKQRPIKLGNMTSNEDINQSALNDVVNQARLKGANYVFLRTGQLNADTYALQNRNNPLIAECYWCPRKLMHKMAHDKAEESKAIAKIQEESRLAQHTNKKLKSFDSLGTNIGTADSVHREG